MFHPLWDVRINVLSYNLQSILYQLVQPCAELQKARGDQKYTSLSHTSDFRPNLQDTNLVCSSGLNLHMLWMWHLALRLHMASWKPCYTFPNESPVECVQDRWSTLIGHCFQLGWGRHLCAVQTSPLEDCVVRRDTRHRLNQSEKCPVPLQNAERQLVHLALTCSHVFKWNPPIFFSFAVLSGVNDCKWECIACTIILFSHISV